MSNSLGKYYKLLGLPITATDIEIKKQYRKLVFLHHPDKNGGDETHFIAITEAYEILSGKKSVPQETVVTSRSASSVATKTREERVREAQQRYKDRIYNEHLENDRYFKQLTSGWKWKTFRFIVVISTLLAIILFTESLLPKHYEEARVVGYSRYSYGSFHDNVTTLVALDNGNRYYVGDVTVSLFGEFTDVLIERSWILHNPKQIISIHPTYYEYFPIELSIGSHNLFFGLLFLIPLITFLYKKRTILFTILYLSSLYIIGIVLIYVLFSDDRWAHLLSLGFL